MNNMVRFYTRAAIVGFTLAELLISLTILGVIATFTIPKVLVSQQNSQYNASCKEAVSMISASYYNYTLSNEAVASNFSIKDITAYLNYVTLDTARSIDNIQGGTNFDCSTNNPCLILHNGAALQYYPLNVFGGTANTNAVYFHLDPDGKYSGSTNGSGKAISIFLYTNGRITDGGNITSGTMSSGSSFNPNTANVPPWFTWN